VSELRRLESAHEVRTPEYVEFEFPIAGLMSRLLAWLIDVVVSTAVAAGITLGIWLAGFLLPGLALALTFVVWFLANWGYFLVCEYRMAGQTLGKKALGLRAIQESGVRLGFYHAALRNLIRAVDHLPALYLVGGSLALFSSKSRRLGDLAAGTLVVRDRRRALPSGIVPPAEAMEVLRADRKAEERVRRASVEEREVLLAASLRREELSMRARLTLFKSLAEYAEERFGLKKPEHLSDEKYVVALTGLLVRAEAGGQPQRTRLVQTRGRRP